MTAAFTADLAPDSTIQLARVHGPLSADLEADFRDVDRTDGGSGQVIDRMRFTLQRARTLIADGTLDELLTGAGADRAEVQARAAAIHSSTVCLWPSSAPRSVIS